LNRFFIPESDGEALLEIRSSGIASVLRQLDWEQWQSILKRLQAISDHVHSAPINLRPIGNPARLPQPAFGEWQCNGHIGYRPFEWACANACPWQSAGLSAAAVRVGPFFNGAGAIRSFQTQGTKERGVPISRDARSFFCGKDFAATRLIADDGDLGVRYFQPHQAVIAVEQEEESRDRKW